MSQVAPSFNTHIFQRRLPVTAPCIKKENLPKVSNYVVLIFNRLKNYITKGFNHIGKSLNCRVITSYSTESKYIGDGVYLKHSLNNNMRIWSENDNFLSKNDMAGEIKATTDDNIEEIFKKIHKFHYKKNIILDFDVKDEDDIAILEDKILEINAQQRLYSSIYPNIIVNIICSEEKTKNKIVNINDSYNKNQTSRKDGIKKCNEKIKDGFTEYKSTVEKEQEYSKRLKAKGSFISIFPIEQNEFDEKEIGDKEIKDKVIELRAITDTNKYFELDSGIRVIVGSIVTPCSKNHRDDIDYITSPNNPWLTGTQGVATSVSRASNNKKGWLAELRKTTNNQLDVGEILATDSGALEKSENIIQIIHTTPPNLNAKSAHQKQSGTLEALKQENGIEHVRRQLIDTYKNPYQYVINKSGKGVLFPLIGTGILKIDPSDSIKAAKSAKNQAVKLDKVPEPYFYIIVPASKESTNHTEVEKAIAIEILKSTKKQELLLVDESIEFSE